MKGPQSEMKMEQNTTPGAVVKFLCRLNGVTLRQEDWTFEVICRAYERDGKLSRRMFAVLKQKVDCLNGWGTTELPEPREQAIINRIFASKGFIEPFN